MKTTTDVDVDFAAQEFRVAWGMAELKAVGYTPQEALQLLKAHYPSLAPRVWEQVR